jgi:hypothetical protein
MSFEYEAIDGNPPPFMGSEKISKSRGELNLDVTVKQLVSQIYHEVSKRFSSTVSVSIGALDQAKIAKAEGILLHADRVLITRQF